MNVIKELTKRIENRLTETKNPCKSYATEAAAEKATATMARNVANFHGCDRSARYVVFYMEKMDRYVGAIDMNELVARPDCMGGYLGYAAEKNFYTY